LKPETDRSLISSYWRHAVIFLVVAGTLAAVFSRAPLGQDQNYHELADRRSFLGIPNFADVASNLGFLIAGLAGLTICLTRPLGRLRAAWIVTFTGITLLAAASAYYHLDPNDQTLVWDRMTLTIGFMGLFIGILGEYISERFRSMLVPAVVIGAYSVLHWRWFDDLRLYYCVQLIPLLMIPLVMALFRPRYTHQWLLLVGAGWYALAKLAELWDKFVFAATGELVSGHTLKHIFAAAGCLSILLTLYKRKPVDL